MSQAQVETTRAQLENARWDLSQTTVLAPGNGTMVNVMLRPGFFVAGMPINEVMTFVDDEYQIFALFGQNELHQVVPGNEAEITLDTYPGRIIKAHVDSVMWAQGPGQLEGTTFLSLPLTAFGGPTRPLPGEARRRGTRQGAVPRCRCARIRRDLYRTSHAGAHHPQGAAFGSRRISTTSSSSTASAWGTEWRRVMRLASLRVIVSPPGADRVRAAAVLPVGAVRAEEAAGRGRDQGGGDADGTTCR